MRAADDRVSRRLLDRLDPHLGALMRLAPVIQDLLNRPDAPYAGHVGVAIESDLENRHEGRLCLCCRSRPQDVIGYCDACRAGRRPHSWFRHWHLPLILVFGYILSPQRRELVSPICAGLSEMCESSGRFKMALRFADWAEEWRVDTIECVVVEVPENSQRHERRKRLRVLAGIDTPSSGDAQGPRDGVPPHPSSFEIPDDE